MTAPDPIPTGSVGFALTTSDEASMTSDDAQYQVAGLRNSATRPLETPDVVAAPATPTPARAEPGAASRSDEVLRATRPHSTQCEGGGDCAICDDVERQGFTRQIRDAGGGLLTLLGGTVCDANGVIPADILRTIAECPETARGAFTTHDLIASHENLRALCDPATPAPQARPAGEDYASRLVLEIGRRRYEATRCAGMLTCSSCPPWDTLSAESQEAWANDWLTPHILGAVESLREAANG